MSRAILEAPIVLPRMSFTGETETETLNRRPAFVTRTVSKGSMRSLARSLRMISVSSYCNSGGMIIVIGWPTASVAVQPKISSAPRFQLVMIPSKVLETMASSEESTMAASRLRLDAAAPVRFPQRDDSGGEYEESDQAEDPRSIDSAETCEWVERTSTIPRSTSTSAVTIDGPSPQYQAENATASHAVWYGFVTPNRGFSRYRTIQSSQTNTDGKAVTDRILLGESTARHPFPNLQENAYLPEDSEIAENVNAEYTDAGSKRLLLRYREIKFCVRILKPR